MGGAVTGLRRVIEVIFGCVGALVVSWLWFPINKIGARYRCVGASGDDRK
jgi:hypothetical protein